MAEEQQVGYGYASDEVKQSTLGFGLNAGKTFLKKFEWIPNGGKAGAEAEALDIMFNINGTEKSVRYFPVTKAFGKNQEEITDPNAQEMKDAFQDLNAKITHILHCYQDIDTIKAAFSRPINGFKTFCQVAMTLLPKNYTEIPLDIFLQYQWQITEGKNSTFLEVPNKMKYGKWLCKAQAGTWTEVRADKPNDKDSNALYYTSESGVHTFVKNGWFVNSNFANQQKNNNDGTPASNVNNAATTAMNSAEPNLEGTQGAAW